jgi:hypothetical protein
MRLNKLILPSNDGLITDRMQGKGALCDDAELQATSPDTHTGCMPPYLHSIWLLVCTTTTVHMHCHRAALPRPRRTPDTKGSTVAGKQKAAHHIGTLTMQIEHLQPKPEKKDDMMQN